MLGNVSEVLSKDNARWQDGVEEDVHIASFIPEFNGFLAKHREKLTNITPNTTENYFSKNNEEFLLGVTEFLYSSPNSKEWRKSFIFASNESLTCGEKSPSIRALKFRIHKFM